MALRANRRGEMRDAVRQLNMGLEERLDNAIGQPVRWPAAGVDAPDGHLAQAGVAVAGRAYRRARSQERGPGDCPDERLVARDRLTTLMVTHSMQAGGGIG